MKYRIQWRSPLTKTCIFFNGPFPEAFNLQTLRNVALHVSPKDTYFGGAKREGKK